MSQEIDKRSIIEVRATSFQAINDALSAIKSRISHESGPTTLSISELFEVCEIILSGEKRLKCFEPHILHQSRVFNSYEENTAEATQFALTILVLAYLLDAISQTIVTTSYATTIRSLINHELYYLPLNDIAEEARAYVGFLLTNEHPVVSTALLSVV